MKRPAILLDRDGTINYDYGYIVSPSQWEFLPGAINAIRNLRDAGYAIAVVTNQSAVSKKLCTEDDIHQIHRHANTILELAGTKIDAFAICFHNPEEECSCRKPKDGLLYKIEAELGFSIDRLHSWMIGDKITDLLFGKAINVRTAIIRSKYWHDSELTEDVDLIVDSLWDASVHILANRSAKPDA